MASFNLESPPTTKDPEKLCRYLQQMYEMLSFVLQNVDNDNLCEDLEARIKSLEEAVFGE